VGGYPQVYEQVWKTPEKFVDKDRRVDLTDKMDIFRVIKVTNPTLQILRQILAKLENVSPFW
jgi:hypothetical protein